MLYISTARIYYINSVRECMCVGSAPDSSWHSMESQQASAKPKVFCRLVGV